MIRFSALRSVSARLTLLNAVLFGLTSASVLVVVVWLADRFMQHHVEENVDAELSILRAEFEMDRLRGVMGLILQRLADRSGDHHRIYLLESAQGARLVGNLTQWPADVTDPALHYQVELPPAAPGGGASHVLARFIRLGDGSRLLYALDEEEIAHLRQDVRRAAGWGLAVALVLALGAGLLINRAALRQVGTINAAAHRIIAGDLSHRIENTGSGDEFDRLAVTLNRMLDRIVQLIEAIRTATDNIAHDLRSPLARHRAKLETALRRVPPADELPQWIEENIEDVDRILSTFNALLRLATIESGVLRGGFVPVALEPIARDLVDLYEPAAQERGLKLELQIDAPGEVMGDRDLLFQALANLLDNALKFARRDVRLVLSATCLRVLDDGPGIPVDARGRVFDRLYRGEPSRSTPGTGLGLSIVRAIARMHGGDCTLEPDTASSGTGVRLELPPRPESRAP